VGYPLASVARSVLLRCIASRAALAISYSVIAEYALRQN